MSDGGNDPEKHRYSREVAYRCLRAAFILETFTIGAVIYDPTLKDTLMPFFVTIHTFLAAPVLHWMGVSNKWGIGK